MISHRHSPRLMKIIFEDALVKVSNLLLLLINMIDRKIHRKIDRKAALLYCSQ